MLGSDAVTHVPDRVLRFALATTLLVIGGKPVAGASPLEPRAARAGVTSSEPETKAATA